MKLDPYEQELYDSMERGEWKSVGNIEEEKKRLAQIAKYMLESRKKEARVNIRVNSKDLSNIKEKANENGLPYQTLISTLLHHFATGKIKIQL